MKILLLEDEPTLNKHIKKYLSLKGHDVTSFDDGLELLDNCNLYEFDFFIFDINVPNIDGLEILEFIRNKNIDVPLIIISAKVDIEDVKKAYTLGCSDYLKKPFELIELELRIESILKQFHFSNIIDLKDTYTYDLNIKQVFKDKEAIVLSKKQNEILYILIKNRGKVISFSTISDYIYEDEMKDFHTISSHVRDIRKKIDVELIKNVRGVGYVIN
jgi:DNA-binding response OmpR family regulator